MELERIELECGCGSKLVVRHTGRVPKVVGEWMEIHKGCVGSEDTTRTDEGTTKPDFPWVECGYIMSIDEDGELSVRPLSCREVFKL